MGSALDIINTVRLHDNSVTNQNQDMQYDLDRRADSIGRSTGVKPMDWFEFQKASPAEKPISTGRNIVNWAATGAIIGALAMPIIAFVESGTALSLGSVALASSLGAIGLGLMGALAGAIDDQKPEIRNKQLKKYESYLDDFEKSRTRVQNLEQEIAENPSTKFRDMVTKSPEPQLNR